MPRQGNFHFTWDIGRKGGSVSLHNWFGWLAWSRLVMGLVCFPSWRYRGCGSFAGRESGRVGPGGGSGWLKEGGWERGVSAAFVRCLALPYLALPALLCTGSLRLISMSVLQLLPTFESDFFSKNGGDRFWRDVLVGSTGFGCFSCLCTLMLYGMDGDFSSSISSNDSFLDQ